MPDARGCGLDAEIGNLYVDVECGGFQHLKVFTYAACVWYGIVEVFQQCVGKSRVCTFCLHIAEKAIYSEGFCSSFYRLS